MRKIVAATVATKPQAHAIEFTYSYNRFKQSVGIFLILWPMPPWQGGTAIVLPGLGGGSPTVNRELPIWRIDVSFLQ